MEYMYECKKNGRSYLFQSDESTVLASPQDEYAWRRGVREYADNYHASITRKGWEGTDAAFEAEIDAHLNEAVERFHSGDVPGARAKASPEKKKAAVVDFLKKLTPEQRAEMIRQVEAA